jgi:hypothetical protein
MWHVAQLSPTNFLRDFAGVVAKNRSYLNNAGEGENTRNSNGTARLRKVNYFSYLAARFFSNLLLQHCRLR